MPNADASKKLSFVAGQLKAMGAGEIRLALMRGLKSGAAPLIPAVKAAALRQLPRGGGLNEQVAGQKVTVSVRTSAKSAGVRLTTTAPDTKQTDSGYVRKPVFGHRDRWVTQQIPEAAGWWSGTLAAKGPEVTPYLIAVIEAAGEQIQYITAVKYG